MTSKQRVLIAEDNPAELRLFELAMTESGLHKLVELFVAYDGEEAIQHLNQKDFDLLLLDLNMSPTPGKVVLQHLHASERTSLTVIVMSNSDDAREIKECYALGANAYVQKPLNFTQLKRFCATLKKCVDDKGKVSVDFIKSHYETL